MLLARFVFKVLPRTGADLPPARFVFTDLPPARFVLKDYLRGA